MGWKADVDERLKLANKAWWVTKKKLSGSKLSKLWMLVRCRRYCLTVTFGRGELGN